MMRPNSLQRGYFLIQTLVFGAIAVVIIGGLVGFAGANAKLGRRSVLSEQAFQIAEAGLEYYRWHLAHAPTDFKDGTNNPGPYAHTFRDRNGNIIGSFSLTITPPALGSTLVTVQSEGRVAADSNVSRTLVARLSVPSFANYATVSNATMTFGVGTEVFGPIHSNGGIRFDGLAHNLVTSGVANYNDPDHSIGANEFGVHTHVRPPPQTGIYTTNASVAAETPPNPVQTRSDVFIAGRSFPAPVIGFNAITADLDQIKTDAQAEGLYFGTSTSSGYKIVLKTDNTFDLHQVLTLVTPAAACTNVQGQTGWGTWSVNTTSFIGNYSIPENGLIFVEDHVWVEGQIDGSRLTIVAALLPDNSATRKSITINNDLLYTNYDGTDVIALIAQNNVNAGMVSDTDLRIDAALVAQNGRVGRFYYEADCAPYHSRSALTLYGTIVTSLRYGFAYSGGTGYGTRDLIYDAYLLYNPPPSFPKTASFHEVISWKEI